ncbi:hypothetical protein Tco_0749909 [Tanacetum coccineum]|uniref:Maturase K n=1 Tax=Tanacetum coccineum TaxID=301880 RepID=A0ABQ4YZR8_9ASTR
MDPVIRCTTLPSHSRSLKGFFFHFLWRSIHFYRLSHSELDDIEKWVSNSLVHSLRALSTLRRSGLRTASAAAEPCQAEEQYNLAYFFVKRIERARTIQSCLFPYGMFITYLYRYVMETYPHLDNGIYDVVERVMRLLALRQTHRPQSDRGKARHSVSSTSAHHNLGSLSHQGDDDEDDGASRASTPSPTTYLNSLHPLNYLTLLIHSTTKTTICLPLPSKPMKLSLHVKPPLTKLQ